MGFYSVIIGIDLNRDFDYNWGQIDIPRYRTGNTPFSALESRVLRDLVLVEKTDVVLDFHGWLNCVYTKNMDDTIARELKLGYPKAALPGYKESQGYFYAWAGQYTKSALIELKPGKTLDEYEKDAFKTLMIFN